TALLAAMGLAALAEALRRGRRDRTAVLAVAAGALVALGEVRPPAPALAPLPALDPAPLWLGWIETHASETDALAFLPLPAGGGVEDYLETTQWMYWQTRHGRPM